MREDIVRMQKLNADFSTYPGRLKGLLEQIDVVARWADTESVFAEAAYELKKTSEALYYDVGILKQMDQGMRQAVGLYIGNEEHILQFIEEAQIVTQHRAVEWVNIPDWVFDLIGNQEESESGR